MSGRKPFSELTKEFGPTQRARIEARKEELRASMHLHQLRQARAMTRKAVGDILQVNQPTIARLETHTDLYISTLRAFIEAMGGRLNITAEFPQGRVVITSFSNAEPEEGAQ